MTGLAEIQPVARHTVFDIEVFAVICIPAGNVCLGKFLEVTIRAPLGQVAYLTWREVLQRFSAVLFAPVGSVYHVFFMAVFAKAVLMTLCAVSIFRGPVRMVLKNPVWRMRLFLIFSKVNNFLRRHSHMLRFLTMLPPGMAILADCG